MNVLVILAVATVALIIGGRLYAPVIGRVLGERRDRATPAVAINDGRDYVPTKTPVVFAHHFASIAGAGPIIGPVIALYYGWGPALLWIVLGGIFIGAVHDYVATHIAVREGGKNLTVVARRYIGPAAFVMTLVLLIALLVLVCAAFLDLSARALTSKVPLNTLQLSPEQKLFRVEEARLFEVPPGIAADLEQGIVSTELRQAFADEGIELRDQVNVSVAQAGQAWQVADEKGAYTIRSEDDALHVYTDHAVIGGIASTSVVVITLCSPLIGFLYLKRRIPVWICSILAVVICGVSIWIGLYLPMSVTPLTWKLMISGYVLISAGLPVWLFLQSRDFINVHVLYVGMLFLAVALGAAAISGGGALNQEGGIAFNNWGEASARLGPGWPVLFVIIACGAVSGFHGLCAGGTTCKQLGNEPAARRVGYYGMLLESFLAVCVVCCLIVGLSMIEYKGYCHPDVGKANAVLTFAMGVGQTTHVGLGLPIAAGALGAMLLLEGFLVTTLDTAIRLTRYMIEEGWATFFARYDVFAEAGAAPLASATAKGPDAESATQLAGTGGLTSRKPPILEPPARQPTVRTSGVARLGLGFLKYYWVNSGIAVALMLMLGLGNGYTRLWPIFGSANQLLGALTLLVASCWLATRRRPVWYTLLPTFFMLVTSVWMLIRLLDRDLRNMQENAPLAITELVVLIMTVGIVGLAFVRWYRIRQEQRVAVPA